MTKVSLYRAKNGNHEVWLLRWYANGRRCSETIGKAREISKREADAQRREKEVAFGSGKERPSRPPKITLERFLADDREAIQVDVSPATLIEHRVASDHATRALGDDVRPDRLTRADCGTLKKHLADRGLAKATISKIVKTMRAAFNRGIAEGLIVSNPFTGNTGGKTQAKSMRIFTADEIAAMIDAAPNKWWALFIRLAIESGLRCGELVNLTWSDIDFDRGSVRVSAKKAKDGLLAWSAKTCEERTVPTLSPDVVGMLQRHKLKCGGSPYVFLSLERLAAIEAKRQAGKLHPRYQPINDLGRRFTAIQRRAHELLAERRGVDRSKVDWARGTIHDMRRTFSTRTADLVAMHVLQAYLGHADITTTARYYLGISDAHAERVRKANADLKLTYSAGA